MTRAAMVGLILFVRVDATGAITGRCVALDGSSARRALPCGPGETVTSSASHAIGMPKGLAPAACRSCGNHPRIEKCDRCAVCQAAHKAASAMAFKVRSGITKGWGGARPPNATREAKARHDRKPERRAAKTAWQRAKRAAA